MTGKAMAIVAAALCAGFFASAVPDAGHDVANGPVEDSGLVAPHIVTLDKFAALWRVPKVGLIATRRAGVAGKGPIAHTLEPS